MVMLVTAAARDRGWPVDERGSARPGEKGGAMMAAACAVLAVLQTC